MTEPEWHFRRATVADLDSIMLLESSIFENDAWSAESMRGELLNRHCYYLVGFRAETPNRIDGYAGLLAPSRSKDADIQTIGVAPASRRSGLGRALVQNLVAEAQARGAAEVFLEVRADNPGAQSLYRGLGFTELGIRPKYYQPDNVDAVMMRLSLPAVSVGAGESTR
jgi:[ribosomal protein S18]-alanine N-acetyltransferase